MEQILPLLIAGVLAVWCALNTFYINRTRREIQENLDQVTSSCLKNWREANEAKLEAGKLAQRVTKQEHRLDDLEREKRKLEDDHR